MNKTGKSLFNNNSPQLNIKLKQDIKHLDKVGIMKYNYEKSFLEIVFIGFCPCFNFCNKKIKRELK